MVYMGELFDSLPQSTSLFGSEILALSPPRTFLLTEIDGEGTEHFLTHTLVLEYICAPLKS